jgi:hypothetical protein
MRKMKIISISLALVFFLTSQGVTQSARPAYPRMPPLEQYLMNRNTEIALARSSAPESIARDAEVLVFTRHGFETAVKGTNGFVCLVARSWSTNFDDPEFWNPKLRAPICYNAIAARSQVPETLKRTQSVLAGASPTQASNAVKAAIESKELPIAEPGSMSYMLSKDTYLSDQLGHWYPHLMFYVPQTDLKLWGAGLPGSPVMGFNYPDEHLTIFLIPLARWSDGTPSPSPSEEHSH